MIDKIEVVIISIVIGALLLVSMIAIATSDKTGPVITVDDAIKLSYTAGQDESVLLQGVSAYDKRDGDVSSSLMVESTIIKGNVIKVRYAAKDKHNNVTIAKQYREVAYNPGDGSQPPAEEQTTAPTENPETPAGEQPQETPQGEAPQGEAPQGETPTPAATAPITDEEKASADAQGKPLIRLKQTEMTIHVGETFNALEAVSETYDASGDISRRIIISGDIDTNTAGDYKLSYLVTNENRVPSDTVELIVHVITN